MTVMQQINKIADKIAESGAIVPDTAFLGIESYKSLQKEVLDQAPSFITSQIASFGNTSFGLYTAHCYINITVKPDLPPDHVSIGRITLWDFYVEDVLLGEEDIDLSNYN